MCGPAGVSGTVIETPGPVSGQTVTPESETVIVTWTSQPLVDSPASAQSQQTTSATIPTPSKNKLLP